MPLKATIFLSCCNIQAFKARKADDERSDYCLTSRSHSVCPGKEVSKKMNL